VVESHEKAIIVNNLSRHFGDFIAVGPRRAQPGIAVIAVELNAFFGH
jgi:hypothetical protein